MSTTLKLWQQPLVLDEALLGRAALVRLAVFDVDGVLTDGSLHYTAEGEVTKVFNTLDGHGLKMLREAGVELAIISGRSSPAVSRRARDLGIHQCFLGAEDKGAVYQQLRRSLSLAEEQVAAIGDDVVDLPILLHCGFAVAVPAAPWPVRERVHYVTQVAGGWGAAREFCEIILHAQGKRDAALQRYSRFQPNQ